MRINSFHVKELVFLLISVSLFLAIYLFNEGHRTQVEAIQKTGVLRVVTRNTPTTYYQDNNGKAAGFEYELLKSFADYLGVELKLIIPDSFGEIFTLVKDHSAHIGAAGLTITEERQQLFRFSPPYAYSTPTLIYRETQGKKAPKTFADLENKDIKLIANSSHAELFRELKKTHPLLIWQETSTSSVTELLEDVYEQEIDYTVSDDFVFDSQKSYFPGLKKSLALSQPKPVAWILVKQNDQSLQRAIKRFFELPETQDLLVTLKKKYLARQTRLGYVDIQTFRRDLEKRFCKLEQYFMLAEQETDIDWRLLASIAYQESHWNPEAVSPTGVKGIMMLTRDAAKEVGVTDRTDPIQSVMGGAHYLQKVMRKIPDRIQGKERIWFALASYNIGYGHLEDARVLTARAGRDPDKWSDVKEFLPLLTQRKHFSTVRYGYARGYEPVRYVKNIRNYYDLLDWELQKARIEAATPTPPDENEDVILTPGEMLDKGVEAAQDIIDSIPVTL